MARCTPTGTAPKRLVFAIDLGYFRSSAGCVMTASPPLKSDLCKARESCPVKIRPFASEDASAVVSLHISAFANRGWTEADYARLAQEESGTVIVAEHQGHEGAELAGFIAVHRSFAQAEILNLAVRPEFRRQGVGSALLAAAFTEMRQQKVQAAFLEVRPSNRDALAFYAAAGFKQISTRKNYYSDPHEDAYVLQRALEPAC